MQNARTSNVSRFQQLVSDNVGSDTGWQAIARMFRLTQSAVQMAGMGTAAARQIKEMTLNYFEDRFANWIVDQGGWVCHRILYIVIVDPVVLVYTAGSDTCTCQKC